VILDTMTSCSGFSFSLGIFMLFLMFLFISWVHGVFYRFHALKIPTSSFHHRIMDVDGQSWILLGFFSKTSSSKVKLKTYFFSWLLPWIYTSSTSMDHRISSILILASCMNACSSFGNIYNRLPPSNRVHAFFYILIAFYKVS
jgi:hypothetical protein